MKKYIIILLIFCSCSQKEDVQPTTQANQTVTPPVTPPVSQANFAGTYTIASIICSNPSYQGWAHSPISLTQNGSYVVIQPQVLNTCMLSTAHAYISGNTATLSSAVYGEFYKFLGGTLVLNGNTLTADYSWDMYWDDGTLMSHNVYHIVYIKQ